jgi:ATP-dependent DNA helicase DinG
VGTPGRNARQRNSSGSAACRKLLGPRGRLAETLPGFRHRAEQVAVAQAVADALQQGRPCLAEAGTGVGKTVAYLTPLVEWCRKTGKRAVVSTHTLALQSQLVDRDIPAILEALGSDIQVAVFKGRRNYLCQHEMDAASREPWINSDPHFTPLARWARETPTGDIHELPFQVPYIYDLTSTQDSCRGKECRHAEACFYYRAKRQAEDAQLLVVNHSLFLADLQLRIALPGATPLLPDCDAVVFDEAHHLHDAALRAFGTEWTSAAVPRLLARCRRYPEIDPMRLAAVEAAHHQWTTPLVRTSGTEMFLDELLPEPGARQAANTLRDTLRQELDRLARDLVRISDHSDDSVTRDQAAGLARSATRSAALLAETFPDEPAPDAFHWAQVRSQRNGSPLVVLRRSPFTVDGLLAEQLHRRIRRSILVSATLSTLGTFEIPRRQLGFDSPDVLLAPVEVRQGSPFNYEKNCLLYVPRNSPEPGAGTAGTDWTLEEIRELLLCSNGRAFVLFTSHRMLEAARRALDGNVPWPVFAQGALPPTKLIEAFVAHSPAVLLGTSSFWEGVDVPGPALSLVVIDKLPFAMPDSPPEKARARQAKAEGRDPFRELALPAASMRLRQGFGRLLRTTEDRGVVAVLDSRLWTRDYGKTLLADLPPCPKTDRRADVVRFFGA